MVFEKVRNMIATQLQVDPASITMESRLVEDLKADSANVMVMILEMRPSSAWKWRTKSFFSSRPWATSSIISKSISNFEADGVCFGAPPPVF